MLVYWINKEKKMPLLGTYIPAACQGPIGNHLPGGWAAFPIATPVEVKNVPAAVTKTVAGAVQIHAPQAWLNGNATEVRDTLIFEGINVVHKPRLDAAQVAFETSNQTLAAYGRAYSDIEAETTWLAGHIFDDMAIAGIGLSAWATSIRQTVMNAVAFPNLAPFQTHFANTPQDPTATDQRQLPSAELYQFEWVSRKSGTSIARKIRDQWLTTQVNALSKAGANSAYDKMANLIRQLTDALTQYGAGTKGRVEKYNEALVALSSNAQLVPLPGFLNTAPYLCPSY